MSESPFNPGYDIPRRLIRIKGSPNRPRPSPHIRRICQQRSSLLIRPLTLFTVTRGQLLDVKLGYFLQRHVELVRRLDVPENVAKLILQLAPDFIVQNAPMVALDLLHDIGDLARLTS